MSNDLWEHAGQLLKVCKDTGGNLKIEGNKTDGSNAFVVIVVLDDSELADKLIAVYDAEEAAND